LPAKFASSPLVRHHQLIGHAAGIVEQQVDPVGQRSDILRQLGRAAEQRQVGAQHGDRRAGRIRRYLRLCNRKPFEIAAGADHPPALPRHGLGDRLADARTRARHHRHPCPFHHILLLSLIPAR
jgi:hypothetical protein